MRLGYDAVKDGTHRSKPERRRYVERLDYWKYSSAANILTDEPGLIKLDLMEM